MDKILCLFFNIELKTLFFSKRKEYLHLHKHSHNIHAGRIELACGCWIYNMEVFSTKGYLTW